MAVGTEGIPPLLDLPADTPASLRPFLESLRQIVQVRSGQSFNNLDRSPTLRELVGNGVVAFLAPGSGRFGLNSDSVTAAAGVPTAGSPIVPVNLQTFAALKSIGITWEGYALGTTASSHAEIWRHTADVRDDAVLVGVSDSHVFPDYDVAADTNYYYWVRTVNTDGLYSAYNATNGVVANLGITGKVLTDEITTAMNAGEVTSMIVDADVFAIRKTGETTTFPFIVGTVGGQTSIILNAATYIADAAIDNAQIGTLSADKLFVTSGTIADAIIGNAEIGNAMIGNIIQSDNYVANLTGWQINKNGNIDANSITIRDGAGNIIMSSGGTYASVLDNTQQTFAQITGSKPTIDADKTSSNTAAAITGQGIFATAPKLTSGNISTYIANVAIKTAQIANAAVDTLQIKGQAVTIPSSAYTSGGTSTNSTWKTIQSLTYTSTGNKALIAWAFVGIPISGTIRIKVAGTIRYDTGQFTGSNNYLPLSGSMSWTPAAGSTLVEVQFRHSGSGTASARSLSVLETQR